MWDRETDTLMNSESGIYVQEGSSMNRKKWNKKTLLYVSIKTNLWRDKLTVVIYINMTCHITPGQVCHGGVRSETENVRALMVKKLKLISYYF